MDNSLILRAEEAYNSGMHDDVLQVSKTQGNILSRNRIENKVKHDKEVSNFISLLFDL